jgi:hypothetical protein
MPHKPYRLNSFNSFKLLLEKLGGAPIIGENNYSPCPLG